MAKLASVKTSIPVSTQLNEQQASTQFFHMQMLIKLLSSIKYLAKQGLALRGHNTGTKGNLHQLMLLRAEDDPKLQEWLKKSEYTSPAIINELIALMGQQVLRKLLEQIRAAFWFGIIADEATDVSHNKQMSISIRWVDMDYTIHEDTLCLVQLENTRAETLFSVLNDFLI